jgi:Class II Aldolase and Adducin N-terminal domain
MTQDIGEQRITRSVHAQRTDRNLASLKGTADLNPLEKLTLAARILAAEGHSGGLAGQITARATSTGHFLTLALGIGFDEACAADVIRMDDDLNVLEPSEKLIPWPRAITAYRDEWRLIAAQGSRPKHE